MADMSVHMAQYSSIGNSLARNAITEYGGKSWRDARDIMATTFDSIASNPSTTPDEQYLAKLGRAVQQTDMANQDAAPLELAVMQILSEQPQGSMQHVLALTEDKIVNLGGIGYPNFTYAVRTVANWAAAYNG